MKGFKDFIMRGNLVELAVAFIIGGAFATVVKTFTDVIMSAIAKAIGKNPDFTSFKPGGMPVGAFITALIAFLILAFVVYFFVVKPYESAKARFDKQDTTDAIDEQTELLREIRDSLRGGRQVL